MKIDPAQLIMQAVFTGVIAGMIALLHKVFGLSFGWSVAGGVVLGHMLVITTIFALAGWANSRSRKRPE